jgi:DNA-binding MarR family transcriptional regulator
MPERMFKPEEIAKIKKLFTEGIQVMSEVAALNEGLNDTIKGIAEELDMKPATLKKALKIAYKNEFEKEQNNFTEVEEVLEVAGHR